MHSPHQLVCLAEKVEVEGNRTIYLVLQMLSRIARDKSLGILVFRTNIVRFSDVLPNLTEPQLEKIRKNDDKLRNQYKVFESQMNADDLDMSRRKRMIYRSKQRGWLEADILLGSWAVSNVWVCFPFDY